MQNTALSTKFRGSSRAFKAGRRPVWLIPALALVTSGAAVASSATWNATSTSANWSDTGNWAGAVVPGNTSSGATASADTATFNSAVSGGFGSSTTPIVVTSGLTIGSIYFGPSAGAFFIGSTAGNTLYLSSGGSISTSGSLANIETINAPIVLAGANANYTFSSNSSTAADVLNFGGTISGGTAGNTVLNLAGTNTGTNTISGIISNGSATSVGIVKSGAGTWALTGTNTYSGGTILNAGTLSIGASNLGTGTLTLQGGTLSYTGSFTLTNAVVAAAGTSSIFNEGSNNSMLLTGALSGAGTITTVDGINYNGMQLGGNDAAFAGTYSASSSGSARDKFSAATAGSSSAAFNLNGVTDSNSTRFAGGTIYLGALSGADPSIRNDTTGTDTFAVGALNTNTSFSGAFTNSGILALTKIGSGTLTLSGVNTYTGGTTVLGGTLALNGGTGTVVLSAGTLALQGGTLLDEGASATTETFTGTTIAAGGSTVASTSSTHLVALTALTRNAGGVVNFVGTAGTNTITTTTANNTSGILGGYATLNGADWATGGGTIGAYTGYTALNPSAGALAGDATTTHNDTSTFTGAGAVTLSGALTPNSLKIFDSNTSAGDSLNIGTNNVTFGSGGAGGLLYTGGGQFTISGSTGVIGAGSGNEFIANVNTGTLTISAQIISSTASAGSLTKAGGGELVLSGTNNYTGATYLDGGVLSLGSSGALGSTGSITFAGGTLQFTSANATDISGKIANSTGPVSLDLNGQTVAFGTGINSTYTGTATNNFTGNIGGLTVNDTVGTGTLKLNAANSYIGTTTINSGNVVIGSPGTLGNTNGYYWDQLTVNGGSLNLGATTQSLGVVNINGGAITNGTLAGLAYNVTDTAAQTVAANLSYNSATSAVGVGLNKSGTGTLTLSGSNNFGGETVISAGAILLNNTNALQSSVVSVSAANDLAFNSGITNFTIGGLVGSSAQSLLDNSTPTPVAVNLTLGNNNYFNTTYSGVLSGAGASLTKVGNSTQTLSGINAYTGGTTVNGGTLILNADSLGNGTITGTLTINAGALVQTTYGDALGFNPGSSVTQVNINGGTFDNAVASNNGFNTSWLLTGGNITSSGTGSINIVNASNGITSNASGTTSVISAPFTLRSNAANLVYTVASGTTPSGIDLLVSGNIVTGTTTTAGITKTGAGTMLFTGVGNYGGTTLVNAGTLQLGGSLTGGTAISATGSGTFAELSTGTISGAASITASGGTVTLSGTNSNTGSVTLTSGQLNVNSVGALGTGTLALNGGTLDNTSGSAIASQTNNPVISIGGSFTFGGSNNLNLGTGAITGSTAQTIALNGSGKTLTLGGTWTNSIDATNTLTVNGSGNTLALGGLALDGSGTTSRTQTIAGSGNLTVGQISNGASTGTQSLVYAGSGTLSVNGTTATTLLGGITVNSGVFQADETNIATNANVLASTSTVTLNGGTLAVKGGSQTVGSLSLAAGTQDTIVLNEGASTAANLTTTAPLNVGASASLFLNLSNAGTGVFDTNLTANTLQPWSVVETSPTSIGIGTTNASKDLVQATASILTPTSNSATTNFTTTGSAGSPGTLVVNSVGSSSLETLFIDAGATSSGTVTGWDLGGSANTVSIAQGAIAMDGANNFVIQDGNLAASQATTSSLTLNNAGTGTLTVSANIVNGSGNSTLTTFGNVTLAGANTFTGGTTIGSGYVRAGVSTIQGTSGAFGNGNQALTVNNGILDLNGFNVGVNTFTANNASVILNNSGSGTSTLTLDNGGSTTGTISGTSVIENNTTGSGLVAVAINGGSFAVSSTGTNTFSGGLTLSNGGQIVLRNGSAGSPDLGSGTVTFNDGTVYVQSAGLVNRTFAQNIQVNKVAGNVWNDGSNQGGETFTGTWTGSGTIEITDGFASQTMSFAGNMANFAGTFDTSTDGAGGIHTLALTNTVNIGMSNAKLILASTGTAGPSEFFQWGGGVSATVGIGELTSSGGASATYTPTSGVIRNQSGGTTATWSIGSLNTSDTYAGTIINGAGTSALTKVGNGTLTLTNGGNSYSGTTTVSGGGLALATSGTLSGTTAIVVGTGASFSEDSASAVTSVATLNITGVANLNGANAAISATTINGGGALNLGNGVSNAESLSNSILDNGAFNFSGGTAPVTLANVITGTGSVTLASASSSSNSFGTSSNAYQGGTTVTSGTWTAGAGGAFGTGNLTITPTANTVVLTASTGTGTLASTATVTVNNGAGAVTGQLVINDSTQTIAALNGNGSVVLNNNAGGTLLTIGNNSANSSFSGVISDNDNADNNFGGAIVKTGSDTLTLSGSNTFDNFGGGAATYSTEVKQGVLNIQNSRALGYDAAATGGYNGYNGAAVDAGATLQLQGGITVTANPLTMGGSGANAVLENVSGNNAYDASITLAGNTTFTSDNGTLTVNSTGVSTSVIPTAGVLGGSGNITLTGAGGGVIQDAIQTGSSSVTMNGTGTWTLGGMNTYTGSTTLNSGTTILTGSIAAGSTVTLGDGPATLMGTGTINGTLVTAADGTGIITPGAVGTVGTLHVGSLTIGAGTAFNFDINSSDAVGGTTNDLVSLNGGTLTVGGSGIVFNFDQLSSLTTGEAYTLINGASSVSGFSASDFSATGLSSGDTAVFSLSGNNLVVTFAGAASPNYYYTGSNSNTFTDPGNYSTLASGGTSQTGNALSSTSSVYLNATSPAATNTPDTLNSSQEINSLTILTGGTAGSLAGTGTLGLVAGITDSATGGTTESIAPTVALYGAQTWTVSSSTNTLAVTGRIVDGTGTNSLTLTGPGTFNFSNGSNSYAGGTSLTSGSLLVSNTSGTSALGTGALTVAPGATIGGLGNASGLASFAIGSGSSTRAQVIVGSGGTNTTTDLTLAASGASTITTANLTFNLNSAVAGQGNELNLGATPVTFSNTTLTLNLTGSSIVAPDTAYVLITDSAGFGSSGLTFGTNGQIISGLSIAGNTFFGTSTNGYTSGFYNGSYLFLTDGGTQIDVEVVPEPSTWAMMLGGLAFLLLWQRRRNKDQG